MLRIPVLFQ
jgi:hypothetical protein